MIHALTQVTLIGLIGMYAIRSSWFLFNGPISPLTPVAAACVVLCVYLFHRAPDQPGPYLWSIMAACAIGAVANGMLLTSTAPAYRNTTNLMFSGVSVALWIALAVLLWLSAASASSTR